MAKITGIVDSSVVDGEGVRTVVFFSGCKHHCKNCHNPSTWDFDYGYEITNDIIEKVADDLFNPYIDGLTISGGDPFYSAKDVCKFIDELNTKKTIWIYSGFTYEEICADEDMKVLLDKCDVLVDGLFVEKLHSYNLAFVGSKNQRIIDIKRSTLNNIKLW